MHPTSLRPPSTVRAESSSHPRRDHTVDDVNWRLTVKHAHQVFSDHLNQSAVGLERPPGAMRSEDHVVQGSQRRIKRQWFDFEHIKSRAGEVAGPEGVDQRGLVDYRGTRGID